MSRLEETTWPVGKCRCGLPTIIRHHFSMDHGYGSGTSHDQLECKVCSAEWRLDGHTLVHIESERKANASLLAAEGQISDLRSKMSLIAMKVIGHVYMGRSFKNQSEEWQEAQRAGLFQGAVQEYKRVRRGKSFLRAISPSAKSICFKDNATREEASEVKRCSQEILKLKSECKSAKASIQKYTYKNI
jgi:hypothetical protein